jgi:hypothetical protein
MGKGWGIYFCHAKKSRLTFLCLAEKLGGKPIEMRRRDVLAYVIRNCR